MKKLLITLSTFALAATISHAANIWGGTIDSPTLMSSANANDYVYKGKDSNNHEEWYDSYIGVDVSSMQSWVASASGGIHSNLHFVFDSTKYGQTSLTSNNKEMFAYNGVPIALGYYFEATDGTTAKVESTNANGLELKLASEDSTPSGGPVYGLEGRTFSIGKGITLEATTLTVSGKLTTTQPSFKDSKFQVVSGGAVNIAGSALFSNTNLYIGENSTFTSGATSYIGSNSFAEIAGTFKTTSGGVGLNESGGKIVVTSTGSLLSTNGFTMRGGELVVNGYVGSTPTSKTQFNVNNTSTLTVNEGGNANIDINLATAANLTISNDTQINVLRNDDNAVGTVLNIADGKTLTASDTNLKAGGSISINGNLHITNIFGIYCTGILNNGRIQADNGFSIDNSINFTIADGASINANVITGNGNLIVNAGASASAAGNFAVNKSIASSGTLSSGALIIANGAIANINGGSSTSDKIKVESGGTFNSVGIVDTGTVEIGATATVNINGGTMTIGKDVADSSSVMGNSSSNFNLNAGATLNLVSETATAWNTKTTIKTGNINVNGGILKGTSKITSSYGLLITKNVSVNNGGQIKIDTAETYLSIGDGGALSTDSTARIDAGTGIVFAVINSYNDSRTIQLANNNVLSGSKDFIVVRTINNKIELTAGESYTFNSLKFHHTANSVTGMYNDITIDLNGAQVEFNKVTALGSTDSLGRIIFTDFANGLVKVANFDSELISTGTFVVNQYLTVNLVAYDIDNNLLNGKWSIDTNGFLFNSALVPEPAEWAAIFGAIALAIAAWRRRK